MRRLYFLIPTIDSAKTIVDELLLARIEQRHIHIAAADHHALLEANLPEANLLQESDFIPAVERGVAIGGATGILAGIAAVALPGVGLVLGGGAIGVEMAQAFARLGSHVTIVERLPHLLPQEDSEISDTLAERLKEEGIDILTSTSAEHVSKSVSKTMKSASLPFSSEPTYLSWKRAFAQLIV